MSEGETPSDMLVDVCLLKGPSVHFLLDLSQHENPFVGRGVGHEELSCLPPVRLCLSLHSHLQFPLAQDTIVVQVVLRLLIHDLRHVLFSGRLWPTAK